ncbi:unnamed protein product, partial [Symbiodinium necroappetens]
MPGLSRVQQAKRALVTLLLALARAYGVDTAVSRESADADVKKAFRKLSRHVHPDKGGNPEDAQRLNAARDVWEAAQRGGPPRGRPGPAAAVPAAVADPRAAGLRVRSEAVLLTYQSWLPESAAPVWERFCTFVADRVAAWKVKYWTATMETNKSGSLHMHLMVQFTQSRDCSAASFAFDGRRPNVSSHDYLGEGACKTRSKLQQSFDRGMFYVWANKVGTLHVAANYEPCWTSAAQTYQVLGKWPEALWKQRKLTHQQYEAYLYLTRDGVLARKRNLDAVRDHEAGAAEEEAMQANVRRVRANPALYQPFPAVRSAQDWLAMFREDRLRYPLLVVLGRSHTGKTEWVKSLFRNPLELKVGALEVFPEGMRSFERGKHDGIILDDVRDLAFLAAHQDKLQGKYDTRVEFATTPGGTCAFTKYLFAIPLAVTVNYSTRNLDFLETHDWLSHEGNRVVIKVAIPPSSNQSSLKGSGHPSQPTRVVNLRGKAPSVRLLQRAHSDVNRTLGQRQFKYSNCGRKAAKGTPKVQKYLVQRLLHLRKRTTCTSSTLRRELLRDKGVELSESAIRKILRSHGYKWLPRAQKRKYSAKRQGERLQFAKAVLRLTKAKLREKLCLAMDGVVLSLPPRDATDRANYCAHGDTHMWRLPSESACVDLAGHDPYPFQIPADRIVPLWGGLSEGGFAIVTFHQKRKFTTSEWCRTVRSGKLKKAIEALKPVQR